MRSGGSSAHLHGYAGAAHHALGVLLIRYRVRVDAVRPHVPAEPPNLLERLSQRPPPDSRGHMPSWVAGARHESPGCAHATPKQALVSGSGCDPSTALPEFPRLCALRRHGAVHGVVVHAHRAHGGHFERLQRARGSHHGVGGWNSRDDVLHHALHAVYTCQWTRKLGILRRCQLRIAGAFP